MLQIQSNVRIVDQFVLSTHLSTFRRFTIVFGEFGILEVLLNLLIVIQLGNDDVQTSSQLRIPHLNCDFLLLAFFLL